MEYEMQLNTTQVTRKTCTTVMLNLNFNGQQGWEEPIMPHTNIKEHP